MNDYPGLILLGLFLLALTPIILAVIGIHRGLKGVLVIFSGWGDFSLSCAVILTVLFSLPSLFRENVSATTALVIIGIVTALWLLQTWSNTQSVSELWFSIPAKLTLVGVAVLGTLLALQGAKKAVGEKMSSQAHLANAATTVAAAAGAWSAMSIIRALIELAQENAMEKLLEKKTETPPTLPIRN